LPTIGSGIGTRSEKTRAPHLVNYHQRVSRHQRSWLEGGVNNSQENGGTACAWACAWPCSQDEETSLASVHCLLHVNHADFSGKSIFQLQSSCFPCNGHHWGIISFLPFPVIPPFTHTINLSPHGSPVFGSAAQKSVTCATPYRKFGLGWVDWAQQDDAYPWPDRNLTSEDATGDWGDLTIASFNVWLLFFFVENFLGPKLAYDGMPVDMDADHEPQGTVI
jgi:hypothetical protein